MKHKIKRLLSLLLCAGHDADGAALPTSIWAEETVWAQATSASEEAELRMTSRKNQPKNSGRLPD